ncbi:MAG TPA: sugar ABC transporter permease [Burkholderiales bacterium]|nr:sugar ABC transporter permease [Burkholderiales bacterium]
MLLAPAGLLFCLFVLYPLAANLWLSLHHWDGAGPRTWAGLENYRRLFADPVFFIAAGNNLRWLAGYALAPVVGLALAVLLNQALYGMRLVRSLFFMPFVVSQVVVGLVFAWFFHTRFGLLNELLAQVGLPPVALLDSERGAIFALILASLWPQTAYCMILYLTGLATLRPDLVEAARMDGASGWRLFRHAVLPQLRPVHFIVGMVCVVAALRSFDYVVIMTAGGPFSSSTVLAYYMYEQTFVAARYGYGAAIATVLLALMSALVGALLWRLLKNEAR